MKNLERVPFCAKVIGRLGLKNSADSVVMLVNNGTHKAPAPRDSVIKWNRSEIGSVAEAEMVVRYVRNSIALYQAVLGAEYIVPTGILIGEKVDSGKRRIKVYEVQPYVSGWDGKTLPEDLRHDVALVEKWRRLSSRISLLYLIAYNVNKESRAIGREEFPLNLTLGASRTIALMNNPNVSITEVPRTPNLLVDRESLDLHLCDFGAYTVWNSGMQAAYNEILTRSTQAVKVLEGTK